MASVSPLSSSANQYGLQQLRAQIARSNVDKAEQAAQSLRAQANDAQRVADREQENARSLNVRSNQEQSKVVYARQGLTALNSSQQTADQLTKTINRAVEQPSASSSSAQSASPSPTTGNQGYANGRLLNITAYEHTSASPGVSASSVVNTQGQVTGRLIHITA